MHSAFIINCDSVGPTQTTVAYIPILMMILDERHQYVCRSRSRIVEQNDLAQVDS